MSDFCIGQFGQSNKPVSSITYKSASPPRPTVFEHNSKAYADALKQYGPFKDIVSSLPPSMLSSLLAADFGEAAWQTLQEMLMQLAPKAGINGVIRKSGIVVADETFVELAEYGALYFFPTILGILLAKMSQAFFRKDLPHFELMGKRIYDIESNLGKTITIGTTNPKKIHVDKHLPNKVGFAKFFNVIAIIVGTIAAEIIGSAMRPILTNKIFKTSNFFKVSGLDDDEQNDNDGQAAIKQAEKNIKDGFKLASILIPSIFGLQVVLGKMGMNKLSIFKNISRYLDMGSKFGLSRTILALTIIPGAAYGYNTTVRNLAEGQENFFRMFFNSWPLILFFKQAFGTVLGVLVQWAHGVHNIPNAFKIWWDETFGAEKGKRDLLDMSFVDINKEEDPLSKENVFSGKLADNTKVLERFPDRAERHKFLGRVYFAAKHAPVYLFALPLGFVAAWLNYQRTKQIYENEKNNTQKTSFVNQTVSPNPILEKMESLSNRAAQYMYDIQQRNFNNQDLESANNSLETVFLSKSLSNIEPSL